MNDVGTAIDDLKERVNKLEVAVIYGNGKPSLLARVESVETKIQALADDVKSIKGSMNWVVRLIIGQLVLLGFSLLPKVIALVAK